MLKAANGHSNKTKSRTRHLKIPDITWDWIISEMEKSFARTNVSEDEKKIISTGYKEIRDILGEAFLTKHSNAIRSSLFNFAPWALMKNADFGQKLEILKDKINFEDIRQRLLQDNFENSFGAEAEIEIAGDFIKKGLEVELIMREKGKKTPDFKVRVDNKWIYFEITTFRTWPDEVKNIQEFHFDLLGFFNQICRANGRFIEVDFNGMTREIAKACIDNIRCKILEMFQSPEESEVIVHGIRLKTLKKEEGYGLPYIHGLKTTIDEMHAISRKLSEKIERKQLPSGKCGVLLIFTNSPFLPDFQAMAERLLEFISVEPDLYAGVVQYICHEQLDLSVNNDIFKITHRTEHDGIYNRYNIIIPNPNSNFKTEEGIAQFLSSCL